MNTQTTERRVDETYIHTVSGHRYYPFDPSADDMRIEVIAHHLSCQGCWAGATQHRYYPQRIFYSVAEHSVNVKDFMVYELKRPDLALVALLHDAPEAYIQDIIRPLKHSPLFGAPFRDMEIKNEIILAEKFNLQYPFPPEVKIADEAVCSAEYQQIIKKHPSHDWSGGMKHGDTSRTADVEIEMLDPYAAKLLFLSAYHEVMKGYE